MNLKTYAFLVKVWLIAVAFCCLNPLFGQSFYQTYSGQNGLAVSEITETNNGFELETITASGSLFASDDITDTRLFTDADGNLISANGGFPASKRLPSGKFIAATAINNSEIEYEFFDESGNLLESFIYQNTNTNNSSILEVGNVAEYANGDLLITFGYGNSNGDDFTVARVSSATGNTVWETSDNFSNQNFSPEGSLVELNEQEEAFITVNKTASNLYELIKVTPQGAISWSVTTATNSKRPDQLAPTSDGGVYYHFILNPCSIIKLDGTGASLGSICLSQTVMGNALQEVTVANNTGGAIVAGQVNNNSFIVLLDDEANVLNSTILDGSEFDIFRFDSGIRLATGEFVLGGETNGGEPFLLKVNENGEFVTGNNGGGVDLELAIATTNANPSIYGNTSITLTITNTGSDPATNVNVEFKKPANIAYTGGNESTTSQGTFTPYGDEVWKVGQLGAGESATLTVSYFLLTEDARTAYAQVIAQNEDDADSTPGNGTPPNPNEDDEAAITLNGGGGNPTFPDLTLSGLSTDFPNTLEAGVNYDFSATLANIGNATASGNFRIGAYLSSDVNYDSNDILVGEINTGNISGSTDIDGLIQVATSLPSGEYFFFLWVDDLNQIAENNENNNIVSSNMSFLVNNSAPNCSGNFVASTQAQLDAFPGNCTTWLGDITLNGDFTDLSPLSNLEAIEGEFRIQASGVINTSALSGLERVRDRFSISFSEFEVINLPNLQEVGGLAITQNDFLQTINSLGTDLKIDLVTTGPSSILIQFNPALQAINSFPTIVNNEVDIVSVTNSPLLSSISALSVLQGAFPTALFRINNNDNLSSLDGLENITAVASLSIQDNDELMNCCAIFDLLNSGNYSTATIANNLSCNSVQDVLDACGGGGNGVDLELDITSNNTQPGIYSFVTVTVTLTNAGDEDASGITVDIPLPDGLTFQGGNESSTATGSYSAYGGQKWNVGSLAAGETATLDINYFVLTDDDARVYGQVCTMNETDVDSTPNNGTPPNPNEDDEAVLVLQAPSQMFSVYTNSFHVAAVERLVDFVWFNDLGAAITDFEVERSFNGKDFMPILNSASKGGTSVKVYKNKDLFPQVGTNYYRLKINFPDGTAHYSNVQTVQFKDIGNFSLFPNPANDYVNVYLKESSEEVVIRVINLQGEEVNMVRFDNQFSPFYQLDLSDIPSGHYFIWVMEAGKRPRTKALMIGK